MFGMLGKLFGSDKVIDGAMRGIDAIVYTDEEKANMELSKAKVKIDLLGAYAPFKIAQRYLAVMFSGAFLATMTAAMVLALLDKPYQPVLDVVEAFSLGYIVLAIVTFYFGGGLVSSAKGGK
jgi:hypothetical protein